MIKTISKKHLSGAPASQSALLQRVEALRPFIGHTPLIPLDGLFQKEGVRILAKLEWHQLGESVKARPAYQIIWDAVLQGLLTPGKRLLDATSGNTGIAYAAIGAAAGIPVTLCLPENASPERKKILAAFGAELLITSPLEGTDGAQIKAKELFARYPDRYFYADQYNNPNNYRAHYRSTAVEINTQTGGRVSHFIAGMGTSGTFRGTVERLREFNSSLKAIALQPLSPLHGLEGWKHMETAIVPGIYDPQIPDEIRQVESDRALATLQGAAAKTGLLLSPSAAANLSAALQLGEEIDEGVIVTVFADNAAKYGQTINKLF